MKLMQRNKQSLRFYQRGFTLIELLVVMAIIAILTSIIAGGFRSSQARGRDAQRKSDLKQVASALELYYSDYGKYPDSPLPWGSEFKNSKGTIYFRIMPVDPSGLTYYYLVDSPTNQKYKLFAHLENAQDKDLISTPYATQCGKPCNFSATSTNTTPDEVWGL